MGLNTALKFEKHGFPKLKKNRNLAIQEGLIEFNKV